jgi:hypothetical protein
MKENIMTDKAIGSLAKKYIDSSLADQGAPPSNEAYDEAVAKVEAATRELLAVQRKDGDRQMAVAC